MWNDDEQGTLKTFFVDDDGASGQDSPERELLRAILRATLHDLQAGGPVSRKARSYMVHSGDSHLLAFNNLCRMLDLDPVIIRRLAGIAETEKGRGASS